MKGIYTHRFCNHMKFSLLALCSLIALQGFSTEEEIAKLEIPKRWKKEKKNEETEKCRVSINGLRGLVLVDREDHLLDPDCLEGFEGIEFVGIDPPGSEKKFIEKITPYYKGKALDVERIATIKQMIYDYYEKNDDPFILVTVPQQKVRNGILQLVITHAKIDAIKVEGNCWYTDSQIKKYVRLQPGDTLQPKAVEADLSFLNRSPFRNVSVICSPGQEVGTTDMTLLVQDQRPFRIFVGADNTGIPTIQRQRLFEGLTFGKVWGLDHLFNVQHTSSYDFHTFDAWSMQYTALLPWKHIATVYGGFSNLKYEISPMDVTVGNSHGTAGQASIRYQIPWTLLNTKQEFTLGFDYKNTNNTILYSDIFENFGQYVNLTQFVFGYKLFHSFPSWKNQIEGNLDLYWSPGAIMSHQTDAAFQSLRPGAVNHWVYGQLSLKYLQQLPKHFTWNVWLRAQLASQNLLPSEQVGFGGYDTVRGYNERQFNTDDGILLSTELHTPSFPLFSNFRCFKKDQIEFLGFVDFGWGRSHIPLPGEPKIDYLIGIGPGLRYAMPPYLSARLDWGIKLHQQAIFGGGESMVHFNVTAGF